MSISGQAALTYTATSIVDRSNVWMLEATQPRCIEVVHTVPMLTQAERIATEKRIASDLYSVLSDIYIKLKDDSDSR